MSQPSGEEEDGELLRELPLGEFVGSGLLQEVNRLLLHPLGYQMAVIATAGTDHLQVAIFDHHDDPEGVLYETIDPVMTDQIAAQWALRQPHRMKAHGFMVQPARSEDG